VGTPVIFDVFWTDPVLAEGHRESGDPLGLRAWASRITQQLVPGLRNGTDRVQAFGLVCAGLLLASRSAFVNLGADETLLRLERAWVISQAAHRRTKSAVPIWAGERRAQRLLRDSVIDLDVPLLSRQLPMGVWGMYRRCAGALGLIEPSGLGRVTAPREARLTPAGHVLARAWIELNIHANYRIALSHRLIGRTVPQARLIEMFRPDLPPFGGVVEALSKALGSRDQELRALRAVWDQEGDLGVKTLQRFHDQLTPEQAGVLAPAAAVQTLCRRVERPYRRYLREGNSAPPPATRLADSPAWKAVPSSESDVGHLSTHLKQAPKSWLGVHRWAKALAAERGREVTNPGTALCRANMQTQGSARAATGVYRPLG